MADAIKDGTGTNTQAKVGSSNQLHTYSVSHGFPEYTNVLGDAYNINTGEIELTSAADTPVFYLLNSEARDLVVDSIAVGFGPSTGGTGLGPKVTVVRNPTAGTTISNANAVDMNQNRNFGSEQTLSVSAYKGATGETMTNGDDAILFYGSASSRLFATVNLILPPRATLGMKIEPQGSNTSMFVYAAVICYLRAEL